MIIFDARDMGLSGTLDEKRREALANFMRCCETEEVEAIFAVHPGRVWRDETGIRSLTFIDLLKRNQIRFRTPYTIFNPLDRMHEKFLSTSSATQSIYLSPPQFPRAATEERVEHQNPVRPVRTGKAGRLSNLPFSRGSHLQASASGGVVCLKEGSGPA